MAQHYTELRKDITVAELQECLDEIMDDVEANPGTVYHFLDDQGRAFVLLAHRHYTMLESDN